jgi:hypothetical protein
MIKAKASSSNFKTLMEFCPSDENLELAVRAIARKLRVFTADDLHVLDVSLAKLGKDRRIYGAVLSKLSKDGFIEKIGYVESSRDMCHNRPVVQWRCLE